MNPRDQQGGSLPVRRLAARFRRGRGRVHMIGIGGVGMAGLARLLRDRGWRVDGCDAAPGAAVRAWLENAGIGVVEGHAAEHVDAPDLDLVIRSAAVPDASPEVVAANACKRVVVTRGQALAALSRLYASVAVCGTHGKTTCTVALTRLLRLLGQDPGWCVGGVGAAIDGMAGLGDGRQLILEADESDGTLAGYAPRLVLLTNVEYDHAEFFPDLASLTQCFRYLLTSVRGPVVYCADDPEARRLCADVPALGYGLAADAALRAVGATHDGRRARFDVIWQQAPLGHVTLEVPGMHNIRNALGVAGAAIALGFDAQVVVRLLPQAFCLPERRFDCRIQSHGVELITDYAHHPTEVAALIEMTRGTQHRIGMIFQPHRYSRTRALGAAFPAAMVGADRIWLTPVYAASEKPVPGGMAADLYARFRAAGHDNVHLCFSEAEAWAGARRYLQAGDRLLFVGAGDIVKLLPVAAASVAKGDFGEPQNAAIPDGYRGALTRNAPLGSWTGLGVGGGCDCLAEPVDDDDLRLLLDWAHGRKLAVHVAGRGANLLIGDDGVDGVTVRLSGAAWRGVRTDGTRVWAGAGIVGGALLDVLEQMGLGGIECMDGIPGCLGGWLAMNAGAHGGDIGSRVASIEYLTLEGDHGMLTDAQCGWSYRRCAGLSRRIALGAWLQLDAVGSAAVRMRRQDFRNRRLRLAGLRTAGSVFRNPALAPAGKLLMDAGCKSLHVGGAHVYPAHANVIVAGSGATASDVRALMAMMRTRVFDGVGVELETEVDVWVRQ